MFLKGQGLLTAIQASNLASKKVSYFCLAILFVGLCFCLFRTQFPQRWSLWTFGDVQTMLAVKHWQEEGFRNTHFLWIPHGYSKATKHLDRPELNHHAHGVLIEREDGALAKLAYTHYPSWYAVGYGVLSQLGIYSKALYQCIAVLISFLALFFLSRFVGASVGGLMGLVVSTRYLLTPAFLEYTDSLANLPLDDCLRFAFLLSWFYYTKHGRRLWLAGILFFFSSLVSLDSIAFNLVAAVLVPMLFKHHRFSLPSFGILLAALSGALLLPFLQNLTYLGADLAIYDWTSVFFSYSSHGLSELGFVEKLLSRLSASWTLLRRCFGVDYRILLSMIPLYFLFLSYFEKDNRKSVFKLTLLFLLAGSVYPFVLPGKALMGYQIRQFVPFLAMFYGVILVGALHWWEQRRDPRRRGLNSFLIVLSLFYLVLAGKLIYSDPFRGALDIPPRHRVAEQESTFMLSLKQANPGDRVVFQLGRRLWILNDSWPGSLQVHPMLEYAASAPILSFESVPPLIADLRKLWKLEGAGFIPLIVFDLQKEKELLNYLQKQNVLYSVLEGQSELGVGALRIEAL